MLDKILLTITLTGICICFLAICFCIFELDGRTSYLEKRIIVLETKLGIDQCHKN